MRSIHCFLILLLLILPMSMAHGSDLPPEPEAPEWLPDREGLLGIVLDRSFLERLPGSDEQSYDHQLTAGIEPRYNPRCLGGSGTDNAYRSDWVDTTDPVTGTQGAWSLPDGIHRIRIGTAGLPAGYGGMQGSCFRTDSRGGDDRFHGILRGRYWDPSWQSEDRRTDQKNDAGNGWEPSAWMSGPMVPGRAWLSLGYKRAERTRWAWVFQDPWASYPIRHELRTKYGYATARLDLEPIEGHRMAVVWGSDQMWYPSIEPPWTLESMSATHQETTHLGAEWSWKIDPLSWIQLNVGTNELAIRIIPEDEDRDTPAIEDWGDNYPTWKEYLRRRTTSSLEVARILTGGPGEHRLLGGVEGRWDRNIEVFRYNGGAYYRSDWMYPPVWTARTRSEDSQRYQGEGWALFLQDEWRLHPRLTLNPGLRYDHQSFQTHQKRTVHVGSDLPAPRLGMVWRPRGDSPEEFRFFLGRYQDLGNLQLPSIVSERPYDVHWENQEWRHYHPPPMDDPGWTRTGGEPDPQGRVDPDLKPERTDEALLAIRRELTPRISAEAALVYRRTRDVIEDVGLFIDPETGEEYTALELRDRPELWSRWPDGPDAYWITNPGDARRDYRGLHITAHGDWELFRWLAAYTWSRTEGTVTGYQPASRGIAQFSCHYDTPSLCEDLYGPVFWDAAHRLELRGVADLPLGRIIRSAWTDRLSTHLGLAVQARSGLAFSQFTLPRDGMYSWAYSLEDRGRGTERGGWMSQVDLSIQQDIDFDRWGTWTLILDVLNLFDQQDPLTYWEEARSGEPWESGDARTYQAPRTYSFQAKYAF